MIKEKHIGKKPIMGVVLAIFCMLPLMSQAGWFGDLKLGGKTARESFDDPNVVALVEAAIDGDDDEVMALHKRGVDVNTPGFQGLTPLMWALAAKNKKGMQALLTAGADPNYKLPSGDSPMNVAGSPHHDLLELLLRNKGNPNLIGKGGMPLLYIAVKYEQWDNVLILLKFGADINGHSQYGDSAATASATSAWFDKVAYLLEHGYNFDLVDLSKYVEIRRVTPTSEQHHWKQKVIEMLKARGVEYPPAKNSK